MIFKNPKSLDLIVLIKLTMGEGGEKKLKQNITPKSKRNYRAIKI